MVVKVNQRRLGRLLLFYGFEACLGVRGCWECEERGLMMVVVENSGEEVG